jgi:hypothetical protein
MSHNSLIALVKYLQKKRNGIIDRATSEVTEEVVSGAVHHSLILSEPYKAKKPNKVTTVEVPVLLQMLYSLRFILLDTSIDVSRSILV